MASVVTRPLSYLICFIAFSAVFSVHIKATVAFGHQLYSMVALFMANCPAWSVLKP